MNAVEIEEAVSRLAEAPFDPEAFPFDNSPAKRKIKGGK
jgi:hypothetical protein